MGDDDKPFACPATGCGMRFTNEDHLTVHKKKHEMSLNLTATIKNSANLFVDQTPTPTRFIRNCEEVGLFQDLNPFEEQFRKAVESAKNGVTETLTVVTDSETLNTPAVLESDLVVSTTTTSSDDLPATIRNNISRPQSSSIQPSSTTADSDDDIAVISTSMSMDANSLPVVDNSDNGDNVAVSIVEKSPLSITAEKEIIQLASSAAEVGVTTSNATSGAQTASVITSTPTTVVQLLLKLPDGRSVPVQIPAFPVIQAAPTNVQPTMTTTNVTSLAKMKLKQALIQNHQNSSSGGNNMQVMTEAVEMVTNQRLHSNDDSDSQDGRQAQLINKRRRTSEEDPDEKRRRFLERNRAAATRCRLKRKQWIQNLERKADELMSTNMQLQVSQNEVAMLRNEVAQLKTMLLAHKDCPVTLQQKSLGQIDNEQQITTISSVDEVTTIQITSAEAIASKALTHMAHAITTEAGNILPIDIIIESDPLDLMNNAQENSNHDVDK